MGRVFESPRARFLFYHRKSDMRRRNGQKHTSSEAISKNGKLTGVLKTVTMPNIRATRIGGHL